MTLSSAETMGRESKLEIMHRKEGLSSRASDRADERANERASERANNRLGTFRKCKQLVDYCRLIDTHLFNALSSSASSIATSL